MKASFSFIGLCFLIPGTVLAQSVQVGVSSDDPLPLRSYPTVTYQNTTVYPSFISVIDSFTNVSKCPASNKIVAELDWILEKLMVLITPENSTCNNIPSCEAAVDNQLSDVLAAIGSTNGSECVNVSSDMRLLSKAVTVGILLAQKNIETMEPSEFTAQVAALNTGISLMSQVLSAKLDGNSDNRKRYNLLQQLYPQQFHREVEQLQRVWDLKKCQSKSFGFIVYQIKLGQYDAAIRDFLALRSDSRLPEILGSVYDLSYFEQIVTFITKLPLSSQRISAIFALHRLMETNGHLNTVNAVTFAHLIRTQLADICQVPSSPSCTSQFVEMHSLMASSDRIVSQIVQSWVQNIRLGNTSHIIQFGSPSKITTAGWGFNSILPSLVPMTYANNRTNLGTTMDFIMGLRWNTHRYTGYSEIMNLVTETEDKMLVAYRMKEAMTSMSGPDSGDTLLPKYEAFKTSLSPIVYAMLWHTSCYFRSQFNSGYLQVPDDKFDTVNRRVTVGPLPNQAHWKIDMVVGRSNSEEVKYTITSTYFNETLATHSTWANYNGDKTNYGHISTRITDDAWKFEYIGRDIVKVFHPTRNMTMGFSDVVYSGVYKYPLLFLPGQPVPRLTWKLECFLCSQLL